MSQNVIAFAPGVAAGTKKLSATTSSSRTQFNPASGTSSGNQRARIYNAGPDTVFIEFGDSSVAAVVDTGVPIPPGAVEVFTVNRCQYMAGICPSSTASIYVTPGEGI